MKKYSLIICIILTLSLMTSCGNKDKSSSDDNTSGASVTTTTTTTTPTEATTATTTTVPFPKSENLKDFVPSSFKNYENYKSIQPNFLNDDMKTLFVDCAYIAYLFNFGGEIAGITIDLNGVNEYLRTGIDYNSFRKYISNVFTSKCQENLHMDSYIFSEFNGELWSLAVAKGGKLGFNRVEFELTSQTDDRIEFKGIAYFDDEFTPNQPNYTEEHNYVIVKTADGWQFDQFELWV